LEVNNNINIANKNKTNNTKIESIDFFEKKNII